MDHEEPVARGTILRAFRHAALDLWGRDGMRELVARLPEDARRETADPKVILDHRWFPERHVMAWYQAAWIGPASHRADQFRIFIDRMMDSGFGTIRSALLRLVTPSQLLTRAPALWRYDHSHGVLDVTLGERGATLRLYDHVYSSTPLSRLAVAEVYRYAVSLSRIRHVDEQHFEEGTALRVDLTWR